MPILALALGLFGCTSHRVEPTPVTVVYADQPAVALAYAPPVLGEERLHIGREGRGPAAFIGYESLVTEYFWLRTDDRIRFYPDRYGSGWGGFDRFERRAVSARVGVRSR